MGSLGDTLTEIATKLEAVSGLTASPTVDLESIPLSGVPGMFILGDPSGDIGTGNHCEFDVGVLMVGRIQPDPNTRRAAVLTAADKARSAMAGAVFDSGARSTVVGFDVDTSTLAEHAIVEMTLTVSGELTTA